MVELFSRHMTIDGERSYFPTPDLRLHCGKLKISPETQRSLITENLCRKHLRVIQTFPKTKMASTTHDMEILLDGLVSFASQGLQQIDIEENFHLIKKLGSGGFASVLLVKDKKTDQQMALKIMQQKRTSERKFLMEFSISFFLLSSHPNIIKSSGIVFKTEDYFAFAQEVAPVGDLFSLITSHVGLPEDTVKRCAMQISSALEYIAEEGLVHMDIKPENVLVFDQECHCVKVTDFGLVRVKGTFTKCKTGTSSYMAPEMCALTGVEELAVDSSLDVWAFGVLLYCLITGEFPWEEAMVEDKAFSRFAAWQNNIHYHDPPTPWNTLPASLQSMLRSLLTVDYSKRSKSTAILQYMEKSWKMDST
ncbi:serine/threonine-protein kinase SBK1-like [Mantella aurantiaca]